MILCGSPAGREVLFEPVTKQVQKLKKGLRIAP